MHPRVKYGIESAIRPKLIDMFADAGGVSDLACGWRGPARSTDEEAAHVHCGIGLRARLVSEPGRLRQGTGGPERRCRVLMLPRFRRRVTSSARPSSGA